MSDEPRYQTWVITEHRQIMVTSSRPFQKEDAMHCALSQERTSYVISDHTQRHAYPISAPSEDA
jgi:hypothetical protein